VNDRDDPAPSARATKRGTPSVLASLPLGRRVEFDRLRALWWGRMRVRGLGRLAHRHAGGIRRVLMPLGGLALGAVADVLGAGYVAKPDLVNFLVATGVMLGGTTAIVFSISLSLLQGVSDMYSSRHLEDYVSPWRGQLIFPAIIVITLGFFATGLAMSSVVTPSSSLASIVVVASLFLIGVAFGLIDRQYEVVRRKVNPATMIAFLQVRARRSLRSMQRDAAHIAKMARVPNDGMTTDEALALAYNRALGPAVADLGRQNEQLVDVALRLAEREEVEMARRAISAAGEIVAAYVEARRTSSVAFPSQVALLAVESDVQPFLSARFEQLNRAGIAFLKAGRDTLAAEVVDVFRAVAQAAKDVTPLGLQHENPVLEWTMLSLTTYMRDSLPTGNVEVVFQGVDVLTEIGVMACDTGLDAQILAVQERLDEFGQGSLAFNTTIVFDRAVSGLLRIMTAAFAGAQTNRHFAVERSLQAIRDLIGSLAKLAANGVVIKNDVTTSQSLTKAYLQLHAVLDAVVARYETLPVGEKRECRRDLVMLFEELRRHFRQMTERVNADSLVAGSIGRLVAHVAETIVALLALPEFADVATQLRDPLRWLCHSPYWFLHESDSFDLDSSAVDDLLEAVTRTGILAWHGNERSIVAQCVTALCDMADVAVEKGGGGGFAQARIVERACYLGILAAKKQWVDVVAELKGRIATFEAAFVKKFLDNVQALPEGFDPHTHTIAGLPHAHQVANDLLRWAGDFENERLNGAHLGDAEDLMYELTDEGEIEAFVTDVWDVA